MAIERPTPPLSYDDYAAIDDGRRYQVLDGELVMTPAPSIRHQRLVTRLVLALGTYAAQRGQGEVLVAPTDLVLKADRPAVVVQPDVLFITPERGGIVTAANLRGAPELVVEVLSPSTARVDTVRKLRLYARYGVPEVWVVSRDFDRVEVSRLDPTSGQYGKPALFATSEVLRSESLPGFELSIDALFAGLADEE